MESNANTIHTNGDGFAWWFGPAFAFFAVGIVAGIAFTIVGGIPGVRALGAFALVASAFGMIVVGYTLRTEDPEAWSALVDQARRLVDQIRRLVHQGRRHLAPPPRRSGLGSLSTELQYASLDGHLDRQALINQRRNR